MKTVRKKKLPFVIELADFLGAGPSREQILEFRPSRQVQDRVAKLLLKANAGNTSREEEWELDQYQHLEELFRLIKANARTHKGIEHE